MHYDESKIKKEFIKINGKKVPVFKIPTGMSGPNAFRISDSDYIEPTDNDHDDSDLSLDRPNNKIYDEDNVYMDRTDIYERH